MLGGIRVPSVPALATTPAARPLSYLMASISGMVMRPIAAAVAIDAPEAAAKPAQAKVAATASPPGSAPSHSRAALNSDELIPE